MTPEEMDILATRISDLYASIEQELFLDIAERLKADPNLDESYIFQWQVDKLNQLGALNMDTIELLSEITGTVQEEIINLFNEVGFSTVEEVDDEVPFDALPIIQPIDEIMNGYVQQTFREIDNFVNQTLITTNYGEGSVTNMYRRIIEETTASVLAGNKTINAAMTDTIIKWNQKGIATGFVDRGGHTWSLEPYTKMVLRTTVNRAYNEVRTARMDDYGIEFVLVSTHSDARPACARAQGKVLSMNRVSSNPKYDSVYSFGYGTPAGLRGISCRHRLTPFVPGVNINNEEKIPVKEADATYEDAQKQRYYERQIRKAKKQLELAEKTGDEQQIEHQKQLVRNRQAKLREWLEETGLPRIRANEQIVKLP